MAHNIEIQHLRKDFGAHTVLRDIDFSVSPGDVVCIIGASGSGKSTLLRCINLLERPSGGAILFHGENIQARNFQIPQYRARGDGVPAFNCFHMRRLRTAWSGK
jgi:putative lysine transport system ATP-binding protein